MLKRETGGGESTGGVRMRIVIGGAGEVGRGVAKALRSEGRDVVLIDNDTHALKEAQALDVLVLQGDASRREDLEEAKVRDAEVFIAATQRDEMNLLSCGLARDMFEEANEDTGRSLMTIARINDSELVEKETEGGRLRRWTGTDHAVCPDIRLVDDLKAGLKAAAMSEVLSLGDDAWIVEVEVLPGAERLVHKTLGEAEATIDGLPRVFALARKDAGTVVPDEDTVILPGDRLAFATVGQHTFRRIVQAAGHEEPEYPEHPRVAIFGATRLGKRLAKSYLDDGASVTVLSQSLEEANQLAGSEVGKEKDIDVMHGDLQDVDLLNELELGSHDISIAVLEDDHANIAVAMQASELGVQRSGLVLDDSDLALMVKRIGRTYAVSRRRVAIDSILQHVHSRVPGTYHLLASVPDLVGMTAVISPDSALIGKPMSTLERGGGKCRVAFIERMGRDGSKTKLRASSDKVFMEGDRLLLFVLLTGVEQVERDLMKRS